MSKFEDIRRLCRICSGVGLYDIHSPIPFYLHSNTNEFLQWSQSISSLVEDLTGCPILRDDTFPQKICSVCISYLKHATQFRRQAINNIKSLRTAREIVVKSSTDEAGSDGCDFGGGNSVVASQLSSFLYDKNNVNINNINPVNLEDYEHLKQELDLFFADNSMDDEGDEDDDDGEDEGGGVGDDYDMNYDPANGQNQQQQLGKAETIKTAIHNFFNYTEKPFEEDDVSNFDRILINEPADDHKERKCYACKRRFMLNETFNEHMKDCIQAKLFSFITDCHQLAIIKKHKAISAQEFIRRMIFSVKSIVKSLAMCYRVYTKPMIVGGGSGGGVGTNTTATGLSLNPSQSTLSFTPNRPLNNETFNSNKNKNIPKKLFNNLSNQQTSNNEILQSLPITKPLNQRRPTVAEQLKTILPPQHNERTTAFALFQTAKPPIIPTSSSSTSSPSNNEQILLKNINFVATCTLCKQKFNSIQSLELHNQQFHNNNHNQLLFHNQQYNSTQKQHHQPTLMSPGEFTIPLVEKKQSSGLSSGTTTTKTNTITITTATTSGAGGTSSTSRSDSIITDNSSLQSSSSSKLTLLDLLHSDDYGHEGIVDVMKLTKKSPQVVNIQARNIYTWKNNGSSQ